MRITRIEVDNLFGTSSLAPIVPLTSKGITIIHGPNGCGKTTLLRLIASLFAGDFSALRTIRFDKFVVTFDDGAELAVTQSNKPRPDDLFQEDKSPLFARDLLFSLSNPTASARALTFNPYQHTRQLVSERLSFSVSVIDNVLPFLERSAAREWVDLRNGKTLSLEDVIVLYGDQLPLDKKFRKPQWLIDRLGSINVGYIKTQRLISLTTENRTRRSEGKPGVRDSVEIHSERLAQIIARKLTEFGATSQTRDRSFPERLLKKEFPKPLSDTNLKVAYDALDTRAQELMNSGLLDQAPRMPLPSRRLTPTERRVLTLYLADLSDKLDLFTELHKKIRALLDIVGTKLQRMHLRIDRKKGFLIDSLGGEQSSIDPSQLSSGQQHQLVLFSDLIFGQEGPSFFLIDEPEISLHVEWQRQFLADLERVASLTSSYFLIATHSPQIINNRRDLTVALSGGVA